MLLKIYFNVLRAAWPAWLSEPCAACWLAHSFWFFLEARAERTMQSDKGAGLPDKKDMKRSPASYPENGTWPRDSFSDQKVLIISLWIVVKWMGKILIDLPWFLWGTCQTLLRVLLYLSVITLSNFQGRKEKNWHNGLRIFFFSWPTPQCFT